MALFQRYAVYYLPDNTELAAFGAFWLGWDIIKGRPVEQFDVDGLSRTTATPRAYGFHGTLKPPFRLADGAKSQALAEAVAGIANETPAFQIKGLQLDRIGNFLALTPVGEITKLAKLALDCVTQLDGFRCPADATELQRRRAKGLTDRQDALLIQWGYPYVAEEFRFHMTLSGALDDAEIEAMTRALKARLPPLPRPFSISSIALVGASQDGTFRLIHRYALTG